MNAAIEGGARCFVPLALALAATACGPTTQPHRSVAPTRAAAPHLDLSTEAAALAALRARFDALVASPDALDAALEGSARRFPEGDLLPATLSAIAYAQAAPDEPSARDAAYVLVARAITATEARIGARPLADLTDLQGQGTYAANLDLALGALCLVEGASRQPALHRTLSELLREALAREGGAPLASYPDERWPIDTVVALAAVAAYARCVGEPPPTELIRAHRAWTDAQGTDSSLGLPFSRVDTHTPMAPRGSDLSWRVALLADLDPSYARAIGDAYVGRFWREGALARGFLEWPDARDAVDADSGPILEGIGATASTFGIAACAATGDLTRRDQLIAQLPMGRALVEQSDGAMLGSVRIDARYVTGFLLGDATLFYALTRPPAPPP